MVPSLRAAAAEKMAPEGMEPDTLPDAISSHAYRTQGRLSSVFSFSFFSFFLLFFLSSLPDRVVVTSLRWEKRPKYNKVFAQLGLLGSRGGVIRRVGETFDGTLAIRSIYGTKTNGDYDFLFAGPE